MASRASVPFTDDAQPSPRWDPHGLVLKVGGQLPSHTRLPSPMYKEAERSRVWGGEGAPQPSFHMRATDL